MCVVIVPVLILFVPAVALAEEDKPNILFIFDSSGSMMNPIADKEPKLVVAKRVLSELVGENLAEANVGLMAYGHREKSGCDDIETLVPIGKLNVDEIKQNIASLEAKGNTPIASALEKGANELQGLKGKSTIVLISDGEETCGGDPIRAAEVIRKRMGINVVIQVIGFDVDDKAKQQLAGIAQAGGGKYYAAKDAEQLKNSLIEIKKEAVVVKEPEPEEYFFDDFDGEDLAEHWEVINPNPDSFIVEDGKLLIVSGTPGSMASETVENVFKLSEPLPTGDWTITAKFSGKYQTGVERVFIGIFDDRDNYLEISLRAIAAEKNGYYTATFDVAAVRRSKGNDKTTNRQLWKGGDITAPGYRPGPFSPGIKKFPQPVLLRLEKKKRSYIGSAMLEGAKKPTWVALDTFTILRQKGKVAVGLYQAGAVKGESTIRVDWVKIEVP